MNSYAVNFSNIGVFQNSSSEIIKAKSAHLAGFRHLLLDAYIVNYFYTVNGKLTWSLSWNEDTFTTEFICELKKQLISLIDKLI